MSTLCMGEEEPPAPPMRPPRAELSKLMAVILGGRDW
jgi:hypothetical protein